jgi:hypothetical protein
MRQALTFPATFVKMNWAAVAGLYYYATGRKDLWSHAAPHRHSRRER